MEIRRFHLSLSAITDAEDPVKLHQAIRIVDEPVIGSSRFEVGQPENPLLAEGSQTCSRAGQSSPRTRHHPTTSLQVGFSSEPYPLNVEAGIAANAACNPYAAIFRKIQFAAATANNGRRGAFQKYHHLIVQLSAETSPRTEFLIPIAIRVSCPLIVRGRSPGHYHFPRVLKLPRNQKAASEASRSGRSLLKKPQENTFRKHLSKPLFVEYGPEDSLNFERKLQKPFIKAHTQNAKQGSGETVDTVATEASDNSSISSFTFSSKSLMSSKSSVPFNTKTNVRLVDHMLHDQGFRALCTDGFMALDPDRFERNLKRLLEIFLHNVKLESSQLREIRLRYRHERARDIASNLRARLVIRSSSDLQRWEALKGQKSAKKQLLQRYLDGSSVRQGYVAGEAEFSQESQVAKEMPKDPETSSSCSDQPSEDLAKAEWLTLSRIVRSLFLDSNAWEELHEGLMGFVVPLLIASYRDQNQKEIARICDSDEGKHLKSPHIAFIQATCQVLAHQPLFSRSILYKAKTYLDDFGQSLQRIHFHRGYPELEVLYAEQKVTLFERLQSIETKILHVYTKCLQIRYQQSYELDVTDMNHYTSANGTNNNYQLGRRGMIFDQKTNIIVPFNEYELHKDLLDIELLIQQLPLQRVMDLATTARLDSSQALVSYYDTSKPISWLSVLRVHALNLIVRITLWMITSSFQQFQALKAWWRTIIRPPIPSGHERVERSCSCGEMLWSDFVFKDSGSAIDFARWLEHPEQQSNGHPSHHTPIDLGPHSTPQPTGQRQNGTPTTLQLTSTVAQARSLPIQTPVNCSSPRKERYLELCINTGEYDIALAEIHITTPETKITSDGQLFEEIRTQYNKHRGFLRSHRWSLFRPAEFCLEDGDVGILQTPLSLPSETDILHSRSWEFCPCPCPLKEPPPIPTNVFLHHFNSTRTHPRNTWLNRLPKKLDKSIHHRCEGPHIGWQALGWGIHIIEGPNKKAVLAMNVMLVLVSLVGAVVWSVLKGDVQGGFGIGGFAVASVSVLIWTGMSHGAVGQGQTVRL
ncbi:MAG: hypothetical protein Q9219_003811 [cf. Caloplaca sp. 3 TL-2023]